MAKQVRLSEDVHRRLVHYAELRSVSITSAVDELLRLQLYPESLSPLDSFSVATTATEIVTLNRGEITHDTC